MSVTIPVMSLPDKPNLKRSELGVWREFVMPDVDGICHAIPIEREKSLHELLLFPEERLMSDA